MVHLRNWARCGAGLPWTRTGRHCSWQPVWLMNYHQKSLLMCLQQWMNQALRRRMPTSGPSQTRMRLLQMGRSHFPSESTHVDLLLLVNPRQRRPSWKPQSPRSSQSQMRQRKTLLSLIQMRMSTVRKWGGHPIAELAAKRARSLLKRNSKQSDATCGRLNWRGLPSNLGTEGRGGRFNVTNGIGSGVTFCIHECCSRLLVVITNGGVWSEGWGSMIQIVLLVVLAPLAGWLPQRRSTNALMGGSRLCNWSFCQTSPRSVQLATRCLRSASSTGKTWRTRFKLTWVGTIRKLLSQRSLFNPFRRLTMQSRMQRMKMTWMMKTIARKPLRIFECGSLTWPCCHWAPSASGCLFGVGSVLPSLGRKGRSLSCHNSSPTASSTLWSNMFEVPSIRFASVEPKTGMLL